MPIQFLSCNAATGNNPIAKQLYEELGGTSKVSGYNGFIMYRGKDPLGFFSSKIDPMRKWFFMKPKNITYGN